MSELFSSEWMNQFLRAWNEENEMVESLAKAGFNSVIGYGFPEDDTPKGCITVENGKVSAAGAYAGQALSWDLRATEATWAEWFGKDVGMTTLGAAVTTGKLKFKKGDYATMLKNPSLAAPFVKSFSIMGRVAAEA